LGEISKIVLSDGTKVVLNSNSKLTLSPSFNRNAREVELDGEAFFDVAKDSSKLFIIRCGAESYIVRGTSFNITSYSSDRYSVATLHEGALEARVNSDIINLVPGEQLRVDENTSTLSKHKVNVEHSTDWITTSRLVFEDTPLRQVANRLARKYQVSINVQPELGNILYTGKNDDETVEEVLRLLEITAPVPLSIKNVNGNYCISKK
jgi:ferric-dicitrate binding protein FerR (iron transport regulator)